MAKESLDYAKQKSLTSGLCFLKKGRSEASLIILTFKVGNTPGFSVRGRYVFRKMTSRISVIAMVVASDRKAWGKNGWSGPILCWSLMDDTEFVFKENGALEVKTFFLFFPNQLIWKMILKSVFTTFDTCTEGTSGGHLVPPLLM